MTRSFPLFLALFLCAGLLLAAPLGCASKQAAGDDAAAPACVCEKGKQGENVWCESCKVGYVDGKKVKCQDCYKAKTGQGPACTKCKQS
ncbi:MAG: hypothetical protein D6731_04870 [Planctomycetota bacterium]|nr:MAG: hypothetical protein D6731_04870 [Planctomycetota bacterium]